MGRVNTLPKCFKNSIGGSSESFDWVYFEYPKITLKCNARAIKLPIMTKLSFINTLKYITISFTSPTYLVLDISFII